MRRAWALLALAVAAPPLPAAEPLGRLFFSPAQRAALDAARAQRSRVPMVVEREPAASLPEQVSYDGVVRRSDGRNTVWINKRAIHDGKSPEGLPVTSRLRSDGSMRLGLGETRRSVDLKVGQSVDVVSGTIAEPYRRAPHATAPPPAAGASGPGAEAVRLQGTARAAARRGDADDEDERPAPR